MKIKCIINGIERNYDVDPTMRLRDFLVSKGHFAVRDSDDAEGFCGSDTILVDGVPVMSNLMMAGEIDGCEIVTPDGLGNTENLTIVQKALIDAGVVQSAYNSPATALLLTWLLENNPNPSKEEIKDCLSGIFIRDAGYEHYYLAVKLAQEKMRDGKYKTETAPSFRDEYKVVGKPGAKVDGPQLVSGGRAFVEDFVDADTCYMVCVRSPHASAYVNSIDTTEAMKVPGVVEILTPYNTPETHYMQAGQGEPEPSPHDRRLLNLKARHVGDRVAAVIAETLEAAIEARDKVVVDWEVLPAVFTVEEAMAEGAPLVHAGPVEYRAGAPDDLDEYNARASKDPREGKVIYQFPLHADVQRNLAASNHGGIGDVDKAFAEADAVAEGMFQTTQIQHTPLETHICFAKMEAGRLVVVASTQVPYHVRRICSWVTGLPQNRIHVIKTRVGGGYGAKQDILVEDLTGYAAFATGRPVLYHNTREEEFIANSTRHPMRVYVKMAGTKDGKLTGIYMDVKANTGPFGNHCLTVPMNSCSKTLPLFKCDNMKYDLEIYYTNCPPAGAYQGYGTPKGTYGLMMVMCELAEKLGIDYKDFVLNNHVDEGYMLEILKGLGEGREGNVVPVGSCGLRECIEKGCEMIEWGKDASDEAPGPDWKVGKGFAMIMQGSGLPGLDHAEALAKLTTDGNVILHSSGADIGTGLDTISAKIVSELICIDMDRITVLSGDTDGSVFDTGSYASSGTFFSGGASLEATKKLKEAMLQEAALQMDEDPSDLELRYPGEVHSLKTDKTLSYYELSHTACSGEGRGEMVGHGVFVTKASSVPYGAHFAQVAVNVKTGEIKVQKFYALQDAGTPINPEIALCQMYGAALKSIGHSLYEDMILDENGVCINANMTDYGVPMISEQPDDFKSILVDVKDEFGPMGAKSISEIACNGAAPAIGNAIHDACGVWIRTWPMTPEKILKELGKI